MEQSPIDPQVDDALDVLAQRIGADPGCPICRSTQWTPLPNVLDFHGFISGTVEPFRIECVVLTCAHCGFVRWHTGTKPPE